MRQAYRRVPGFRGRASAPVAKAPAPQIPARAFATGYVLLRWVEQNKRYVFECGFNDRLLAKAAGFWWDPSLKQWWTNAERIAAGLVRFADDATMKRLAPITPVTIDNAALLASRATDADIFIPAPKGLHYLPFQKAGIAFCLQKFGLDLNGFRKNNSANAKGSLPKDGESASGVEGQSGEGPLSRSAGEGRRYPEGNRERRSLAGESQRGDGGGDAPARSAGEAPGRAKAGGASTAGGGEREAGRPSSGGRVAEIDSSRIPAGIADSHTLADDPPQGHTAVLQSGLRAPSEEDRNRDGRPGSSANGSAGQRQEEERGSSVARLASVPNQAQLAGPPPLKRGGDSSPSRVNGVLIGDAMG